MVYIDPVIEYERINNWITPMINQSVKPKVFVRKFGKLLNKYHPVRVKLIRETANLNEGDFCLGAEYEPDLDQANKKQIYISLYINHPKNQYWPITEKVAESLVLETVEVLVHEYQHQQQYRKRRFKLSKEKYISEHVDQKIKLDQEYLGHPDEIDAYSANIAARLFLQKHLLNTNVEAVAKCDSLDLKSYYRTFGKRHSVVKDLLDRIKINLQYLEDVKDGKITRKHRVGTRSRRSK